MHLTASDGRPNLAGVPHSNAQQDGASADGEGVTDGTAGAEGGSEGCGMWYVVHWVVYISSL